MEYETSAQFIERNGCSDKELSEFERWEVLKVKDIVLDTIEIGGEKFVRVSYPSIGGTNGGTKIDSHIQGQFGDRFFEAQQREGLIKVHVVLPNP